jgi:tetratricopeptide (TPR) repeat protein
MAIGPIRITGVVWRFWQSSKMTALWPILTDAIRLAPDSTSCFLSRGLLYSNMGRLDKAVADFDQALAIDPNLIDAKTNRDFAAKELEKQKSLKLNQSSQPALSLRSPLLAIIRP